jgi:protein-glutamine gamma-glutamyltransferase
MYDIKQFKPTLYVLILLGITGFAMVAQLPGFWIVSVVLVLLNAWLVFNGRFRPLPRLLANSITVLAFFYIFLQLGSRTVSPIFPIGQFLVLLQLVKLWEQRANRDYAQLLVLSLLLMVAASISTASLVFGLMLIGYLFLSLYCCLLFHLKVETDEAKAGLAVPPDRVSPATLQQDQRYLSRSMRRLTGLVATFAIAAAVLVFVFFPRGTGAGLLGQFQWRPKDTLTGFSEQVSFQQVAKITQNNDVVATVKLWKDDTQVEGNQILLLRGVTHETYNGNDDSDAPYQWSHANEYQYDDHQDLDTASDWYPRNAPRLAHYKQEIELNPTGTGVIFAMAGPVAIQPQSLGTLRHIMLRYSPSDEVFQCPDPITQPIKYTVLSTGVLGNENISSEMLRRSNIDPKIAEYARIPEVTGGLASQRQALAATRPSVLMQPTDLDEQIATNIEKYLRMHFSYTLDLTDTQRIEGRDPIVAFLYDFKRGHCEYFASAMTLMCQSLGMQARMVVGFKCDDYNNFGHFYQVRQSQAHAWVEVLTTSGWKTFDPTSASEYHRTAASLWQNTRHFFDYLEYTWANAVIAYDSRNRDNLIQTVDNRLSSTAMNSSAAMGGMRELFNRANEWVATRIVGPLIALLALAMVGAILWFFYERYKLRRRASRIGIESLSASDQMRLIRQLGFYDDLMKLLERHQIVRPRHLTPLEFSDSLAFLPSEVYDTIRRLTGIFYRIRYGESELDHGQRRRLALVIDRLAQAMPQSRRSPH